MTTIKSLFIAGALTLTPLLGSVAPVSAQEVKIPFTDDVDPYEISNKECVTVKYYGCAMLETPGVTLKRYIEVFQFTEHLVLEANQWPEEMLDSIITVNLFFKVTPS